MDISLQRILSLIPKKENGDFVHGAKKEFAESIGLKSGNLISDWINGRSTSYTGYLYQISAKYGVSVAWLKGEEEQKTAPTPKGAEADPSIQELFNLINDATPEEMAEIANYIKYIKSKRK